MAWSGFVSSKKYGFMDIVLWPCKGNFTGMAIIITLAAGILAVKVSPNVSHVSPEKSTGYRVLFSTLVPVNECSVPYIVIKPCTFAVYPATLMRGFFYGSFSYFFPYMTCTLENYCKWTIIVQLNVFHKHTETN
jgi:hypothetical protein